MPRGPTPPSIRAACWFGVVLASATTVVAADSPEVANARSMFRGLRERGFGELIPAYAGRLRDDPATTAGLRDILDYEEGKGLLELAGVTPDLARRTALLESARVRLDAHLKARSGGPEAGDAHSQLARLLVERGHLAHLQAQEAADPAASRAREAEARASYEQARQAYAYAVEKLTADLKAFPGFLPENDPRRGPRDQTLLSLLNAELQRALVDYEDAQTFAKDRDAKDRSARLDGAAARLEDLYQRHRTQLAGFHARKWQAKCLEEKGDLNKAMGIYKELMEHSDPRLRTVQQEVGYYQIIVSNKRKEWTAAADAAAAWLRAYPGAKGTQERLGVLVERARALLAQKPNLPREQEREAIDGLNEVLRFASPLRGEALAMIGQNRPKGDKPAPIPAGITYDNAMTQANQAIGLQDWDRAVALLRAAGKAVDPARDPDKANEARYLMAYAHYEAGRYYEAAVLAEHLVDRYPRFAKAAQAADIALASWTQAYSGFTQGDRSTDLNHLIGVATRVAEAFPDAEQEQAARMTLGEIALGQGRYAEAADSFERVKSGTPRWTDARMRAGAARWKLSGKLREEGQADQADDAAKQAQELLASALKARQDAGAGPTDPGLVTNACELADVLLATEQNDRALALLDPMVKEATDGAKSGEAPPQVARLISTRLRAHVATGQTDAAIADMKTLESVGGEGTPLTRLYFELGRLLQRELDSLKAKGQDDKYKQTQLAYAKFLEALAASTSGQSYESLQWAGEALLGLGQGDRAAQIFGRVLETFGKDAAFQGAPNAEAKLLRTRLKLVAARRSQADAASFPKALDEVNDLIKQHPRSLDPLLERCRVLEDWAAAEPTPKRWDEAIKYWQQLALALERTKPPDYYDAWYHVAYGQWKKGSKADAARTLRGRMALSKAVGGPEIKKRYEDLLKTLGQ